MMTDLIGDTSWLKTGADLPMDNQRPKSPVRS